MPGNVKRVFYVRYLAHPCYLDIIAQRGEIRIDKIEHDAADETAAQPIMAAAHAYQIGSARDELPAQFHLRPGLLARMPSLLIVSTNGAGFDTVDVEACTQAGVLVVNQSGGNAEAVATHVLAMLLCLAKQVTRADHALRRGSLRHRSDFMGNDVKGCTIGIIGLGNVGTRLAALCRGLSMQVLACDPYLDAATIAARGAAKVTLEELLQRADFVSVNCPLTAETRGMIAAREFALMAPHAYFINTARGFIHDERALAAALLAGRIAGAGIDVWDKEPPAAAHALLQFDNVIATPHTAGLTAEARESMGRIAAEQLIMALDGKRPPRIVNPQAWPAYARRFEQAFGIRPQES